MLEALNAALGILLVLLICVSFVQWGKLLWVRRSLLGRGFFESILPAEARRVPFLGAADALLMLIGMCLMLITLIVTTQVLVIAMVGKGWIEIAVEGASKPEPTAVSLISSIVASSVAGLAAVVVGVFWMRIFDSQAIRRLGLRVSVADIKTGLKGALLILPPVMMVSAAIALLVPYEHPVLESLEKNATPAVFLATFVGTAIVTPLVEEVLVRCLLQGSLQAFADRDVEGALTEDGWRPSAYWPVVVSSLVFASLHIGGQGAAPIPIFVLSLGLGFLYRQTGSLVPSIVVHMVLNGLTLTAEFLKIMSS